MSSSSLAQLDFDITAKIQKGKMDAKSFLRSGRFYWTNAGFHKEVDRSKGEHTKSPLRSFHPLLPPGTLPGRELLRVSRDTTIWFKTIDGGQKRGKKLFNRRHPCYLAEYDESTNQGVIFLGTGTIPDNAHRFVIVHSGPAKLPLPPESLGTKPPYSFRKKETYLNISHPLRVHFAYFSDCALFPSTKEEGHYYNGHEPPLVAIANFVTQSSDVSIIPNDGLETSVVFEERSEHLFWKKHEEYHRQRPSQLGPNDDSDGAGPDDDSGGDGPDDESGGAGPNDDSGGTRPDGVNYEGGPDDGGLSTGGAGSSIGGSGSNRGGSPSCEVEDAPWGRVGEQCIGIDIPLVIEDISSDSDEEMDLEELVINYDATNAPWGQVGDQRIGIDIPLVTEDIYSDSDEEMDLESREEFLEVDDVVNVVEPESSNQKGIITWPNPSDKDSSWSYTIPKPYFVISMFFNSAYSLLDYDHLAKKWRWTSQALKRGHTITSIEGLSYQTQYVFFYEQGEPTRTIFNWHTKNKILLPLAEGLKYKNPIVGMIVDTSVRPYAFKVIEGSDRGTLIYDSTTDSWTHRLSVPPQSSTYRFHGHANVATCKGVVFIIDSEDQILLYDPKKDKWDCVRDPREHDYEKLCGIGSWDDRVFSSSNCMPWTIEIRELVGMTNPEWKKFHAMPREMYSWFTYGAGVYLDSTIDMSYCSENLLIWSGIHSSVTKFVLCNLARKKWEKFELPIYKLRDHNPWSRSMALALDKDQDKGKGKNEDE